MSNLTNLLQRYLGLFCVHVDQMLFSPYIYSCKRALRW